MNIPLTSFKVLHMPFTYDEAAVSCNLIYHYGFTHALFEFECKSCARVIEAFG